MLVGLLVLLCEMSYVLYNCLSDFLSFCWLSASLIVTMTIPGQEKYFSHGCIKKSGYNATTQPCSLHAGILSRTHCVKPWTYFSSSEDICSANILNVLQPAWYDSTYMQIIQSFCSNLKYRIKKNL